MEMSKTIRKWFWVWDFEKEENWLNEMALNGWVLESVGFCTYHFVRCEPGEYAVRLEMHPYDESYVMFMQETGAKFIGRMMMWIYFHKKTSDGPFDLFSDIDSKIDELGTNKGKKKFKFGKIKKTTKAERGLQNQTADTLVNPFEE